METWTELAEAGSAGFQPTDKILPGPLTGVAPDPMLSRLPHSNGSTMNFVVQPWHLLHLILAGRVNQRQQQINDYLRTENQILREILGKRRVLLDDDGHQQLLVIPRFRPVKRTQAGPLEFDCREDSEFYYIIDSGVGYCNLEKWGINQQGKGYRIETTDIRRLESLKTTNWGEITIYRTEKKSSLKK